MSPALRGWNGVNFIDWNDLTLRIGSAAFAKRLRQAREASERDNARKVLD
jgi:hypothetical protein